MDGVGFFCERENNENLGNDTIQESRDFTSLFVSFLVSDWFLFFLVQ